MALTKMYCRKLDKSTSTIKKASPSDGERFRDKSEVQAELMLFESSRCEAMRQSTIRHSRIFKHRELTDEVQAAVILDARGTPPAVGSMTKDYSV
jgi:hypothetical protein